MSSSLNVGSARICSERTHTKLGVLLDIDEHWTPDAFASSRSVRQRLKRRFTELLEF